MTVSVQIQHIAKATSYSHEKGAYSGAFDTVNIIDDRGTSAQLFLPPGTGASVAAAINAAVNPPVAEAAE